MNILHAITLSGFLIMTTSSAKAQSSKFIKPEKITGLHTLYTYQKSNWDGSRASWVYLYVKDNGHIESFKYHEGDKATSLVTALFDWEKMVVTDFTNHRVDSTGHRKLMAQLKATSTGKLLVDIAGFKDSMTLTDPFWHSYDFDLASLSFAWRALKNEQDGFSFMIADAAMINGRPGFENKGAVQVKFSGIELLQGKEVLKYTIDGEGLQNRGGEIWIDPANHYMISQLRIAHPDEEGYDNNLLKLVRTETLSASEWEQFIIEKMQGK